MNTLIALMALTAQEPVVQHSDDMLNLATADQTLVHAAIVPGPVKDVWRAFTTTEGIKSWMVAEGDVDLKIGGKIRTGYQPGTDLSGPDAIENTIIAFDPERMLAIRNTKSPETFPFKKAISQVWTVVYFDPIGAEKTRVTSKMIGFRREDESMKMRRFFMDGNKQTLNSLIKHFEGKRT
ncbi:MAG: SRPBCC domain-containing protein [Armatimonadetes bacterium]|nr:SRPBCC domain-containing protein [Armatimonadota bacterium]